MSQLNDKKPACDCIETINAKLKDHGSMLETDLISGCIVIRTIKADFKRRIKPPYLIASHCPACGVAYVQR